MNRFHERPQQRGTHQKPRYFRTRNNLRKRNLPRMILEDKDKVTNIKGFRKKLGKIIRMDSPGIDSDIDCVWYVCACVCVWKERKSNRNGTLNGMVGNNITSGAHCCILFHFNWPITPIPFTLFFITWHLLKAHYLTMHIKESLHDHFEPDKFTLLSARSVAS